MKKTLALLLTAVMLLSALTACGSKNDDAADDAQNMADADKAAADHVAALIDAIYVQERTDETDAQCEEAKAAWDALTDAQKAMVEGEEASPDYFGLDTGDAALDDPRNQDGIGENELLDVALSLETPSEHPLAKAVVQYALEKGRKAQNVADFAALPGNGLTAKRDGAVLLGGSVKYMQGQCNVPETLLAAAEKLSGEGKTPLLFSRDGAILGMTRAEIDAKLPQIIEFSECGDFIDTPVKRYSSGMFVKLAFAVAAHLDSEIMVMDEVLAVGDMKFQQKCLGKMSDVAGQEGRTVLYVSHNMSTIRQLCTRCVVLDQGRVIFDGDVEQAIAVYMETTDVNVVHYDLLDVSRMNASAGKRMRLETLDFVGKESSVFADTEKIRVRITWRVSEPFAGVHLKLNLHFRDSTPVGITHPVNLGAAVPGKLYTTEFEFDPSLLGEGQYFFYVDVFDGVLTQAVCLDKPVTEFAFEVTSGDLTMPEWAPGWGRIHFPPVKVLENGYDG